MEKYYFPLHLNGGNRGCEAISKGTALILGEPKENLIGLCSDIKLDKKLGVDNYVTLIPQNKKTFAHKIPLFLYKLLCRDRYKYLSKEYELYYDKFIGKISEHDIMVSTGGDMMCYGDNQAVYTVNRAYEKGIKSILFACSMGKENLTERKFNALKKFSILYARETLTEEFFKSLGLRNVVCFPDPAFILEPQSIDFPTYFEKKNVIGLNISNMILKNGGVESPFMKDLHSLIEKIITKTDFQLLLIPHVFWKNQDDRVICNIVYNQYKYTSRVYVLDSNSYNYCEIRYIISHCEAFIGARTHAVISAYSTCVPALALGYSIKARGIVKDLCLSDRLIVRCDDYQGGDLLRSFDYLINYRYQIREHLLKFMPLYKKRLAGVKDTIKSMLK